MDHQSEQPMLGRPVSGAKPEVVDMENQRTKNRISQLKTSPYKWFILAIVLLSLLCLIFLITICVMAKVSEKPQTCLTTQCLRSASNFLESMDTSVDPCDNFQQYICGKWNREHFIRHHYTSHSWFMERAWVVEKDTIRFLSENDKPDDPEPVKKARALYRGCMDFDSMSEVGYETVSELMRDHLGMGLYPPLPGGRLLNVSTALAKAKMNLNLDVFIGLSISPLSSNNTILKFLIASPQNHVLRLSLKSRVERLRAATTTATDEEDEDEDQDEDEYEEGEEKEDPTKIYIWRNEVHKFVKHLYMMHGDLEQFDEAKIKEATWKLAQVSDNIDAIRNSDEVSEDPTNTMPTEMTVYELQKELDKATRTGKSKIQIMDFFKQMYRDIGIEEYLKSNETLLVNNVVYLTELSKYMDKLTLYDINLWIWWKEIYNLGLHIDKYTTQLMHSIDEADSGDSSKPSRSVTCSNLVITLMKNAASYMVMREPDAEIKRAKIKQMLAYIKEEFKSLINDITWMDEETKARTLEKVTAMNEYISYPEERKNLTYFNSELEDINVNETTHLVNLLQILGSINQLEDLDFLNNPTELTKAEQFDSLDTNAYYTQSENSIYIPGGILQFPFYDLGLEALNYGSIGTILGHEVTHGFDNEGRSYDKNGNMNEWWTEKSDREYQKRIPCYINDYGSYYIESINMTVDGNLTLGENIADIGGLLEAYRAYQQYVIDHGPELKLPGFENFTSEQLFFMSNAMTWCSEYTPESLAEAMEDEHSPDFVRTIVSFRNSPEFAKAWNCPKGSNMNPDKEKCQLWID